MTADDKKVLRDASRRARKFMKELLEILRARGYKIKTDIVSLQLHDYGKYRHPRITSINGIEVRDGFEIKLQRRLFYSSAMYSGLMCVTIFDPCGWQGRGRSRTKNYREPKKGFDPVKMSDRFIEYIEAKDAFEKSEKQKRSAEKVAEQLVNETRAKLKQHCKQFGVKLGYYPIEAYTTDRVRIELGVTPDEAVAVIAALHAMSKTEKDKS